MEERNTDESESAEPEIQTPIPKIEEPALPSLSEILSATHVLSPQEPFANKVVRVGDRFAVKYGHRVSSVEAETMQYLSSQGLPVPKCLSSFTQPDTDITYIIMEFIPGDTLMEMLPSLSLDEREQVFRKLWTALEQLRSLPPPDYLGCIGRRPYSDGFFDTEEMVQSGHAGPYASQLEMNEALTRRLAESCVPSHVDLLRKIMQVTFCNHRTVFTHGDLQPKNIMLTRNGTHADGSSNIDVTIIDWGMSGWYPEYWEFGHATAWEHLYPEWLEEVQKGMKIYPHEYLLMKDLRRLIYLLGG